MATKLTKKEQGFVKDYIKTGNGTKAALKNYDTTDENTAAVIASRTLRKDKVVKAIATYADRIPDDLLERVHLEGLNATKKNNVGGMAIGLNKDGDVESMGHTDIVEPDFATRHKYLDSAYKLKGSYAPEKRTVQVDMTEIKNKDDAELAKLAGLED